MNPIEKDIRSYYGVESQNGVLEHYGTKNILVGIHSSGENPYQHSGDFLSRIEL